MKPEKMKRDTALDFLRVIAAFLVISVHFFWNTEFYQETVVGKRMYLMTLMRTMFMSCVPLFLILSGYLMRNKKACLKYYCAINRTLWIYLLASLMHLFFKINVWGNAMSFKEAVLSVLDFTAANYSWYVSMYIGLYLMIPFLNLTFEGCDKKQKKLLIVTLIILTTLPSICNIFDLRTSGWWLQPTLSDRFDKIVPDWWTGIYPITYYFIGCYLAEFKPKIRKIYNFGMIFIFVVVFGSFNYYRSYGGTFKWGAYSDWGGIQNVVISVLLFIFIMNLDFSACPSKIKEMLAKLSELSFGCYLLSYIADQYVYKIVRAKEPVMVRRLEYYPIAVLTVFLCSMLLSYIINWIYRGLILRGYRHFFRYGSSLYNSKRGGA